MGDWNDTVPTFVVGKLRASSLDTLADIATALTGAWTPYTPVWTSSGTPPTQGNVVINGAYRRLGKTVDYKIHWVFGSSSAVGTGNYFFTLPVTSVALTSPYDEPAGAGVLVDVSLAIRYKVNASIVTSTTIWLNVGNNNPGVMQATAPVTWASGDWFSVGGTYEAA